MFSTFTGSSRRPRNVNLSGQTGNPFANTSWTPSAVSNATKTVSDAQADREKRQAERQRVKAAGKIQRTWRGHRARRDVRETHRADFDQLYQSNTADARPPRAFTLLISFFTRRRDDDMQRLVLFARDVQSFDLSRISPANSQGSAFKRLVYILIQALDRGVSENEIHADLLLLLRLLIRIIITAPTTVIPHVDQYYTVLAKLCHRLDASEEWSEQILEALSVPLQTTSEAGSSIHQAYAFRFLTHPNLRFFEANIPFFCQAISLRDLAGAIVHGYFSSSSPHPSNENLLWLLAHSIDLGRVTLDTAQDFNYLESLHAQLSALSSEISLRIGTKAVDESADNDSAEELLLQPLDPYVANQLTSLVENDGISRLLQDFSRNLAGSSNQEFHATSLLAGYILALLRSFPGHGDDIRMRLFLEQIPTPSGDVPTVKYLWQIMKQTSVFRKLEAESEKPVEILRRYLQGSPDAISGNTEEQDWRVILLFLELYIFILRLSDDEDFFSAIRPSILESNASTSRIRSCSLPVEDIKLLSIFLKNTAFSLHYQAQALSQSPQAIETATKSRVDSYFSGRSSVTNSPNDTKSKRLSISTRLDLESLRGIITTAMKMLYERDSRDQFLPSGHWLMLDKLNMEDFIRAVIDEEERQSQQDSDDSDVEMESQGNEYDAETGFYFSAAGQRLSRHARLERLRAQQMRAMKERRLAEMGPKLEILKHMPFVVPFETRVRIFRDFTNIDRTRRFHASSPMRTTTIFEPYGRHHASIRRNHLFEDAFENFYQIGEGLKDIIQITFVDKFGSAEAGIDGGGVTKEFLTGVTSEAFGSQDKGMGLFKSSEKGLLFPDPTAADTLRESLRQRGITENDLAWRDEMTNFLKRYEFLGRIIGKCMYENILVDLSFARFFLLKWTSSGPNDENGYKGSVNDLRDMDEELYKGMLQLKHYPGDVTDLGFDFTISDQVSRPGEAVKTITRKLIANGDQVSVTNDNRLLYISYVARHRLVVQPSLQTTAFLRGLRAIIRPSWLSMFNQSELQRLVGGDSSEIDLDDLRANTIYSGLYVIGDDGEEHPTIKLFWKVMAGFTDAQRRDVLKYVSSTPRAPLLGFSALRPKFSIRDGGTDEDRLPSTSTCVNLLKLPRYTTETTLREKLLYAVQSGAGFDLS